MKQMLIAVVDRSLDVSVQSAMLIHQFGSEHLTREEYPNVDAILREGWEPISVCYESKFRFLMTFTKEEK